MEACLSELDFARARDEHLDRAPRPQVGLHHVADTRGGADVHCGPASASAGAGELTTQPAPQLPPSPLPCALNRAALGPMLSAFAFSVRTAICAAQERAQTVRELPRAQHGRPGSAVSAACVVHVRSREGRGVVVVTRQYHHNAAFFALYYAPVPTTPDKNSCCSSSNSSQQQQGGRASQTSAQPPGIQREAAPHSGAPS